jgi:TonB family protein
MFFLLVLLAAVEPPAPVVTQPASYPADALARHAEASVVVRVTITQAGDVTEAEIAQSGGEAFDAAALRAVQAWKFRPALKDGAPVAAKIRVPFDFRLPASQPASLPASAPAAPEETPLTVNVHGKRVHKDARGASDIVIDRQLLVAAPHPDAGSMLRSAPGVYVSRVEGDAVAHEIFLRGFDAEHGQDIELTMAGVPLNRVSHIHAQGYSDLNVVMPEIVRSLRVVEGVYDPRQGDFAVAGSIHFDLGVVDRGLRLTSRYGSFNTFRQTIVYAPREEQEQTFGAASFSRSDGFGQNRASMSGSATGQYAFSLPFGVKGLAHVTAFAARGGLAGALRRDDVQAGRVDFYGVYDDPSARAQSAFASRAQAMLDLSREAESGARSELQAAFVTSDFSLRENFTGYTQGPQGDLLEQRNTDYTFNGKLSHRFAPFQPATWLGGVFEAGLSVRHDVVDQKQNRLAAPGNTVFDPSVDATIHATDLGAYGDLQLRFLPWLALRGGLRADVLAYDVEDRLPSVAHRTAMGVALGPRVSVDASPLPWLKIVGAYGEGYRSPQARQLVDGQTAPFTKVRSAELGATFSLDERLSVTATGFLAFVQNELVFEAEENRLTERGPTSRKGAALRVQTQPLRWLTAAASVTYVNATLDAPPVSTDGLPQAPGDLVPYAPSVVFRCDAAAFGPLTRFGGGALEGRVGAGVSAIGPRPLYFGQFSPSFATLDAQASLSWRWITVGVEGQNLTNARYAASEFVSTSNWTRAVPSLLPARHTVAGAPLTLMGVVTLGF